MKYSIVRLVSGGIAIVAAVEFGQGLGLPPPGIAYDIIGIPEPGTTIQNNIPYGVIIAAIAVFWMFKVPAPSRFNVEARE